MAVAAAFYLQRPWPHATSLPPLPLLLFLFIIPCIRFLVAQVETADGRIRPCWLGLDTRSNPIRIKRRMMLPSRFRCGQVPDFGEPMNSDTCQYKQSPFQSPCYSKQENIMCMMISSIFLSKFSWCRTRSCVCLQDIGQLYDSADASGHLRGYSEIQEQLWQYVL